MYCNHDTGLVIDIGMTKKKCGSMVKNRTYLLDFKELDGRCTSEATNYTVLTKHMFSDLAHRCLIYFASGSSEYA